MTEARRIYRLSRLDLSEVNRLLADLGERLDQIEGYREQPLFQQAPRSSEQADASNELVVQSQVDAQLGEKAGATHTHSTFTAVKVYAADDSTLLIHGLATGG